MPGYGTLPPDEGTGLLPWAWAEERLIRTHDFWVASTWPDGRPHLMPVWGVWLDRCVWFSSGLRSRKARNLLADPRCAVTTDNAQEPVMIEGNAEQVTDLALIGRFLDALSTKYSIAYEADFLDPAVNASFRVRPAWAFGLIEADFGGSPTRWRFS